MIILTAALVAAHAGKRVVPGDVAERLAERVPMSELSAREIDVLRLAASGNTRTL